MTRGSAAIRRTGGSLALLTAFAALIVVAIGCDRPPADAREVTAFAGPLILPGASDVRSERDSPDVGISVFSYKTPPGIAKGSVTTALRDELKRQHPCYEAVEASGAAVQWRCTEPAQQLHGSTEIRAVVDASSERTFVLMLRSIPADPQTYKEFVSTLDQAVQRARQHR